MRSVIGLFSTTIQVTGKSDQKMKQNEMVLNCHFTFWDANHRPLSTVMTNATLFIVHQT